ncbi:uncharacterized protein M6B38_366030 [Iris pallida]|uniref:Uncharacterized protein n=1 Tax=Iris pallida TaxID=29817 RepID=A0AAX6GH69_IRIPA|nr:uncharacterized protein M6B38_366030 [Iris pallida]
MYRMCAADTDTMTRWWWWWWCWLSLLAVVMRRWYGGALVLLWNDNERGRGRRRSTRWKKRCRRLDGGWVGMLVVCGISSYLC